MVNRAALVILALCAFLSRPAYAGFALAKPPTGWVKTQAGAVFKAPHTFPGNDGYFRTTVAVNVGGRMVDLPAGLRVSANAASFVAPAIRAGGGALFGPSTLAWLAAVYGIEWVVDRWMRDDDGPNYSGLVFHRMTPGSGVCRSPSEGCTAEAMLQSFIDARGYGFEEGPAELLTVNSYNGTLAVGGTGSWSNAGTYRVWSTRFNSWGSPLALPTFVVSRIAEPGEPERVPVPDQDWQAITGQLPVSVAQELAAKMPLPVELPEALPLRVPLDSPQPVPATNPQRYKQQIVDIVPRPTAAEPWRVELKPGELESEDPNMTIDPAPLEGGEPEATPTPGEDPKPGLCEEYPDVLACQKLGEIEPEPLPEKTVSMAIDPTSGWGEGGGSCPADRSVSVLGRQVSMKWSLFCDFADQVRPVVVAMAWLSAVLGFVGLSRRES